AGTSRRSRSPSSTRRSCARSSAPTGRRRAEGAAARGRGWQTWHTWVPRPAGALFLTVLGHRRHGWAARRWTRSSFWKAPWTASGWRKCSVLAPPAARPAVGASAAPGPAWADEPLSGGHHGSPALRAPPLKPLSPSLSRRPNGATAAVERDSGNGGDCGGQHDDRQLARALRPEQEHDEHDRGHRQSKNRGGCRGHPDDDPGGDPQSRQWPDEHPEGGAEEHRREGGAPAEGSQ